MQKILVALCASFLLALPSEAGMKKLFKTAKRTEARPAVEEEAVEVPKAESWSPLGFSFAPTVAAYPSDDDAVCGLRLGIISSHKEMHGISMNLLGDYDQYVSDSLRLSAVWHSAFISRRTVDISALLNMTGVAFLQERSGSSSGVQLAFLMNFSFGDYNGLQVAAGNFARNLSGIQLGLVNSNGDSAGLMAGICNFSTAFSGIQFGLVNRCAEDGRDSSGYSAGLQVGGFNITDELRGLQLGALNYAKGGRGVQIGILNFFGGDRGTRVLPLVNARF